MALGILHYKHNSVNAAIIVWMLFAQLNSAYNTRNLIAQEACMVPGHITNAGEMNGFLKTSDSLLRKPLVVEGNAIKLESNFRPALDEEMVARYSEATRHFP